MIYDRIIDQSRNPMFYTKMGVPDDLSGRFNMIVIHLLIWFVSIKKLHGADASALRQCIFEDFIREVEEMVRGFGVVEENLRAEVEKIVGNSARQIAVYEDAIASGGKTLSAEILKDFRRVDENSGVNAEALAEYVLKSIGGIQQSPSSVLDGHKKSPA